MRTLGSHVHIKEPKQRVYTAKTHTRSEQWKMTNLPVWTDDTPIRKFPKLQRNITVDVLFVGAGVTGITVADLLKKVVSTVALHTYNFEQLQFRTKQQVEWIEA